MKKTLTVLMAAAMLLTAVSCGKDGKKTFSDEAAPNVTAEITTKSIEDILAEYTTTAEELEKQISEMKETAMERVDLTAQKLQNYEIPDDWKEMSDGRIKFLVPPDVEDKTTSKSKLIMGKFQNEDRSVAVTIMNGNDWNEHYEAEAEDEDDYFPEVSEENVVKAFKELGIDYDGTRTSFYKAVLSFTSADRTDENAKAFDTAALAKGLCFLTFPEVFYGDHDGHDVYAHGYPPINSLGKKSKDSDCKFWVGAFADSNTEYTLMVTARSREEALMICSTITFC
ncbi:MAG: hypothetical protein IKW96_02105 [Ruminococcus sp.]|uniref:hypothetical protein n=1 Tax=Ruminococcus sp. TaxID=41978 RepID=UPI002600D75B|nr:hypothetical protein [Ruminococcus sp.]MBR5682063.1 hypothetical protein [Ruminococcus sp.]